jgi:hypothetical protein
MTTRKEAEAILAQARVMDAQRASFERLRFPDPTICAGCGYPLTSHPRMGCAFVDGAK